MSTPAAIWVDPPGSTTRRSSLVSPSRFTGSKLTPNQCHTEAKKVPATRQSQMGHSNSSSFWPRSAQVPPPSFPLWPESDDVMSIDPSTKAKFLPRCVKEMEASFFVLGETRGQGANVSLRLGVGIHGGGAGSLHRRVLFREALSNPRRVLHELLTTPVNAPILSKRGAGRGRSIPNKEDPGASAGGGERRARERERRREKE